MALRKGTWQPDDEVLVRVHEPFTAMDLLDVGRSAHSWPLPAALTALQAAPAGVAVLLNCGTDIATLMPQVLPQQASRPPRPMQMDLRTYGVGAQILRQLGVRKMKLLGSPRRMPSMAGYGLEVTSFVRPPTADLPSESFHATRQPGRRPVNLDGSGLSIGIVQARFNADITDRWPLPAWPNWLRWASMPATSATSPCPGRWKCRGAEGAGRPRRVRRADRAGLHHPRRDLPLRAGGQRERRRRQPGVAGPPDRRWPTPSSRSRTRRRPGPALTTRAATPPAWRWRWPTCWTEL
jgi:GTP cyclohydrolase II